jgi:hypothetical protein
MNKDKIDICKLVDDARYSDILDSLLDRLKAKKVLFVNYESSYQGDVDIDVLLKDGRVFSYHYYYGSCSGCDDWENRDLTDEQIEKEMEIEATFFDDMKQYKKFVEMGRNGRI